VGDEMKGERGETGKRPEELSPRSIGGRLRLSAKRWAPAMILAAATGLLYPLHPEVVRRIGALMGENCLTFLGFVPPVFVLLGLFDVWVPRERVITHLGEESHLRGILLSFALGALAAGPLYISFPIASAMREKGAGEFNLLIFVGAWSTLKVPMFLFEFQSLGGCFALTRYVLSVLGVLLIAWILTKAPRDGILQKGDRP